MGNTKLRIVHYVNQFFGQIGGEEKADLGYQVKEGPVGPALLLNSLFGDQGEVVATVVCGDNYFVKETGKAVEEGLKLVADLKPDVFFAGPAFNAGRYGIACGAIASAVQEKLGIPAFTGLFPENPGADIYRKKVYIVKTGDNAGQMKEAVTKMVKLAQKVLNNEPIGNAEDEGYLPRGFLKNQFVGKCGAVRGIDMLMAKIAGQPFETELKIPQFEDVPPAQPIKDIKTAKIALVSDGGLVPKANPDNIKVSQNTVFGVYDLNELFAGETRIAHSGYHPTEIRANLNRLVPKDILEEMEEAGQIGQLWPLFYSTSGNTTTIQSARNMGQGIAQKLVENNIDGVILTST
jgi:betaine reductase